MTTKTKQQQDIIQQLLNGIQPRQMEIQGIGQGTIYRELRKLRLYYNALNNEQLKELLLCSEMEAQAS